MRYALYWAPPAQDVLAARGAAWLGRDAESGDSVSQPPHAPGLDTVARAARHYGFHCTLRPPMRLATSLQDFCATARRIAGACRPFDLPPLRVAPIGGFLALTVTHRSADMEKLAEACVRETEPHRAAATPAEQARRRAAGLSLYEEEMLHVWGYPYVMQAWFFHMTLTCRLSPAEQDHFMPLAQNHFAPCLQTPRQVEDIGLFVQEEEDDFRLAERFPLG